jgi:hypothetical protein
MNDLIAVVPSRGRPDNARMLAEAFASLCTAGTQLVFAVDDDDPTLPGYTELLRDFSFTEVVNRGPWQPMVPKLNGIASEAARLAFAVAFMGDDHRPRIHGWDTAIIAALRDLGTGIVYGDDLLQRERLCTAWAMTSDIVRTLGRMVPAPVEHMYCDNSVMDLGNLSGCLRYLPDVVVEHCHPLAGKAEWDIGYARVNRAEQFYRDKAAYQQWADSGRDADVAAVKALRGRD